MDCIGHDHPDAATLAAQVADAFERACAEAIRARGEAWLALAGGRTPLPAYRRLANSVQAAAIIAIPTDERRVPHDHPACNLRALREAFAGSDATLLSLTRDDGTPDASRLATHPHAFDAVLLGMGADGHVASLFPGAANLGEGLAPDSRLDAIATTPVPLPPEAPYPRISLTLPRLLRAKEVHLVVAGAEKRRVLQRALREPEAPFPVAALLHAATVPVHIHWSP